MSVTQTSHEQLVHGAEIIGQIRGEQVLPEGTLTRLRAGRSITLATVDVLCRLCSCQPGDLLRYIPDEREG